uniref:Uncharacterized protein n=1 Tax=Oryza glumipatula TaxID=40148 RepID=A0A0E0A9S2_9ORYZ
MALAASTVATGDCGCGIGRREARWLDLYRLAAAGATRGGSTSIADWRRARRRRIRHGTAAGATATGDYG